MQDWDWISNDRSQSVLAGAMGGVVRWITLKSGWRDGLTSIAVGCICALYLNPVFSALVDPILGKIIESASSRTSLSSFLVGLTGVGFTGFLVDLVRFHSTPPKGDE